jgi:NADPH-dependent 7-cyano-7-deazaguanine reductase QueF
MDDYGLNYKQKHFEITKIIAERFYQKLHPDSLTVEDHNSEIHWKYIESFREMNRMQEQYDGETSHGLDRFSQNRWNQRIEAELKGLGVK